MALHLLKLLKHTYHENLKIGPVHSEVIGLQGTIKKKESNIRAPCSSEAFWEG